jgi:hypothetical protein
MPFRHVLSVLGSVVVCRRDLRCWQIRSSRFPQPGRCHVLRLCGGYLSVIDGPVVVRRHPMRCWQVWPFQSVKPKSLPRAQRVPPVIGRLPLQVPPHARRVQLARTINCSGNLLLMPVWIALPACTRCTRASRRVQASRVYPAGTVLLDNPVPMLPRVRAHRVLQACLAQLVNPIRGQPRVHSVLQAIIARCRACRFPYLAQQTLIRRWPVRAFAMCVRVLFSVRAVAVIHC